jgi:hypothetical protein
MYILCGCQHNPALVFAQRLLLFRKVSGELGLQASCVVGVKLVQLGMSVGRELCKGDGNTCGAPHSTCHCKRGRVRGDGGDMGAARDEYGHAWC